MMIKILWGFVLPYDVVSPKRVAVGNYLNAKHAVNKFMRESFQIAAAILQEPLYLVRRVEPEALSELEAFKSFKLFHWVLLFMCRDILMLDLLCRIAHEFGLNALSALFRNKS